MAIPEHRLFGVCQNVIGSVQYFRHNPIRKDIQALSVHGRHSDIDFHLVEGNFNLDPVGAMTYSFTG